MFELVSGNQKLQTWSRSVGPDGRFMVGVVSLPDHFRFRQHGFRYENLTPRLISTGSRSSDWTRKGVQNAQRIKRDDTRA